MAETTGIAWTDGTFNPWIGCTNVGPGCDHCYAEAQNNRWHGGANWGAGAPRRGTSVSYWNGPLKWNRARAESIDPLAEVWLKPPTETKPGTPAPLWVFAASQADIFDNEVDPAWRADFWRLVADTPLLRWQLVTKRVSNVPKMLPEDWWDMPDGAPRGGHRYQHVGIIATAVNQEEIDREVPRLARLKINHGVRWTGLSVEPHIGPVRLLCPTVRLNDALALDWVIDGGESIQQGQVRPYALQWGCWLKGDCTILRIPFFMKQIGSKPVTLREGHDTLMDGDTCLAFPVKDRAGADPAEWPESLRVREMPRVYDVEPAHA